MSDSNDKEQLKEELEEALKNGKGPKVARFALAVISGLIPFAGGAISGGVGTWSEAEQERFNKMFLQWLKLQEEEIKEIGQTLWEVYVRLDHNDEETRRRIESPEYLSLIKKCFRDWSAAESEEKRKYIRNLLANAASCKLTTDDVIRLFIEWIEKYSETHFLVISCIYQNSGITRHEMWEKIYGTPVREDSAEADLFKLVIQDLSIGHIVRQHREVDYYGNFKKYTRTKKSTSQYMTSAFDDEKEYELTNLGRQFVHYTMNEIVPKLTAGTSNINQN
jgi:hypothetical protein